MPLLVTHRAVQPQREQHQEEDDGKEGGSWHVCNGLCVGDEEQAGSWSRELASLLARTAEGRTGCARCLPGKNSPQAAVPCAVTTTAVKLQSGCYLWCLWANFFSCSV